MSTPPKTVLRATDEEAAAIREAVRNADPATLGPRRVKADLSHVPALVALLSDEAVSGPIYDLPRPITADSVTRWVAEAQAQALAGEGLLVVNFDEAGEVAGYSKITVWPERSSAELAGAMRADLQNHGEGGAGAAHTFGWIFETLGVELIGLTAAVDNVRSAKLIEAAGFRPMGEREVTRPDGSKRQSLAWEMTREAWERRHRL
jgi:RimJ/RimL family protein N-acetyltransferase